MRLACAQHRVKSEPSQYNPGVQQTSETCSEYMTRCKGHLKHLTGSWSTGRLLEPDIIRAAVPELTRQTSTQSGVATATIQIQTLRLQIACVRTHTRTAVVICSTLFGSVPSSDVAYSEGVSDPLPYLSLTPSRVQQIRGRILCNTRLLW
jgi:hypothetical protein